MQKETISSATEISQQENVRKNLLAGLFVKKIIPIKNSIYWEELTCIGYDPQLSKLQAVVSIKRSTGYSGNLCSQGSTEYVRFFVDWGDGSGFMDVGLTSFRAVDIPDAPPGPQHPLKYMVYLSLNDETRRKCCNHAVLPKVRAILSWNQMPSNDPDFDPIFGNRLDASIQIQPKNWTLACMLEEKIVLPSAIDKDLFKKLKLDSKATLPKLKPGPTPWAELMPKYKEAGVPDHRPTYATAKALMKSGIACDQSLQMSWKDIADAKIDFDEVLKELSSNKADVTFEELVCLGLNTNSDTLGAVVKIKRSLGYSGSLCDDGSREYVAFWADWDNSGSFDEYLGTAFVTVHDIGAIPADGLYYGVQLSVSEKVAQRLRSCKKPNVVKIRAVLSWAVPPSTTDPSDLNYWGNRLDAAVQIRPGNSVPGTELACNLLNMGGVGVLDIDKTSYYAYPNPIIPATPSICPYSRPFGYNYVFGGSIWIQGRLINTGLPGTVHYQVQYKKHDQLKWNPVTFDHTFYMVNLVPGEIYTAVPKHSSDGWFTYQDNYLVSPPIYEKDNSLAFWSTGSLNGEYDLRVIYTDRDPHDPSTVPLSSEIVTIILDNTGFKVDPFAVVHQDVDINMDLDIVIDIGDCHSYKKGEVIVGHLRAIDERFGYWVLDLQPIGHVTSDLKNVLSQVCRSYNSLSDKGDENLKWTLDTSKLDVCGYTLTLRAYDRAILNSNSAICHWATKSVGFSVRPAEKT